MRGQGFVISGCSGGGKSSLIAELRRRGCAVVDEPGRRVIEAERATGGGATPWGDPVAFATKLVDTAREDLARSTAFPHPVFFDRGLIDAAAALERVTDVPVAVTLQDRRPYCRRVFLAPPWPDIYVQDVDRRHTLSEAIAEYSELARLYPSLGYEVVPLPKQSVAARADLVFAAIA